MQSDYVLCRDIMRLCHDAHPDAVHFTDLRRKFPDRTDETIRYHANVLKEEGFLETRKLRSTAGSRAQETTQSVRLSHPLAADRFIEWPSGPAD